MATTISPQQATIDRNRALAMALQAQGMSPLQSPNVRGARTSPWEGVNKIAQSLMAGYQNQQLDQQQAALTGQENAAASARTKALVAALMDPKTDPAKASAIVEALNAGDPAANIGLESILPQAPPPDYTLGQNQNRISGTTGATIAQGPVSQPAPRQDVTMTPFEAWQKQNPEAPVSDWYALTSPPKPEPAPKNAQINTVETAEGVFQYNPESGRYDIRVGGLKPTSQATREGQGYGDLSPKDKASVDAVAAKVAAGEYTIANGLSALGGVRGGLGGALTEALADDLVIPTSVRKENTDIERAKNLIQPIRKLVDEINNTKDMQQKVILSARLENYVSAIGTQFARAKGERGVVTDRDVSRVLGLLPGWKSANFAPQYAEDNLKLVEEAFLRDQQALLGKYFTKFQQGGTAQQDGAKDIGSALDRIFGPPPAAKGK